MTAAWLAPALFLAALATIALVGTLAAAAHDLLARRSRKP